MEIIKTIGRRKTSIARCYVQPGKGQIIINDRELTNYFTSEILQTTVKQALTISKQEGNYDVNVNVEGGGVKGQAEAIRMGIARAIVKVSEGVRVGICVQVMLGAIDGVIVCDGVRVNVEVGLGVQV